MDEGFNDQKSNGTFTPFVFTMIIVSFVMGTAEFIIIGTSSSISDGLGVSIETVGMLVSIFAVAYIVGTPLVTIVTTSIERFRLMMVLLAVFCASLVLPLIWSTYPVLLVSRVLTAIVSGPVLSIGMAMIMEETPPAVCGHVIAWIYSGFSVSAIISLPLGSYLSHVYDWHSIFVVSLILGLVAIGLLAAFMRKGTKSKPRVSGDVFGTVTDPRMLAGILITVFSITGIYTIYTYITPFLEDVVGIPGTQSSLVLLGFGVASVIGSIASGFIAQRYGMKAFVPVFVIQAILLAAIPLSVSVKTVFLIVLMMIGLTIYLINATNQMHFVQVAAQGHPSMIGFASSLNPIAFNVGTALGGAIGSAIVAAQGVTADLGYYAAVFSLLAAVAVIALRYLERDQSKKTSVS